MKSMTGFGTAEFHNEDIDLNIIIKTVNNKYLDIKTSLPEEFYIFENKINQLIEKYIKRGTVYLKIFYIQKKADQYQINHEKLQKIKNVFNEVIEKLSLKDSYLSVNELIEKYDLIYSEKSQISNENIKNILNTIEKALINHKNMAENEGKNMKKYITKSTNLIQKSLSNIIDNYPLYKKLLKQKLQTAIKELIAEPYDKETMQRFMLELSFYIEKYDVSEEIVRLQSHISALKKTFTKKIPIGKKMNFILQEMRREINTIASKYSEVKIFDDIIIIKEEIEKIREIIQNVE